MIILSVLIPTIPSREGKFNKLFIELSRQRLNLSKNHSSLGEVEILYNNDKPFLEGGMSIGEKRQRLLDKATGKYICFLDDDDNIAPNYLETLVRLCNQKAYEYTNEDIWGQDAPTAVEPDCITFRALFKNDFYWSVISMSLYNVDQQAEPGYFDRNVWHINAIKADIAKKYRFDSISHGEDVNWLKQVRNSLKTEMHTDTILTQYNHSEKESEADKIVKMKNFENTEPNY